MLRFWETKFPQVKPLKRGGGRRYYRPDDIALLRRISDLLYIQGYTIKGVQRLLREGGGRLSDDIPPATAAERAEAAAKQARRRRRRTDPELADAGPAPGTPSRAARARSPRAAGRMCEAERLRALLATALHELESCGACCPDAGCGARPLLNRPASERSAAW